MAGKATVRLAGKVIGEVELAACAQRSDLIAALAARQKRPATLEFERFPGGAALLRSVLAHLASAGAASGPGEPSSASALSDPTLATDTLGAYLEAAILFRSPGLISDLVNSPVCRELSSRHALPLLEQSLLWTSAPALPESSEAQSAQVLMCGARAELGEWSEAVEGAFAEVIAQLCAQLDLRDFRLGPPLARGSAQASLEVLRAYRSKLQEASLGIDSTLRSTATMSVFGTPSVLGSQLGERRDRVDWTEHQFASHVLRLHLLRETQLARSAGSARRPRPAQEDLLGAEADGEAAPGADGGSECSSSFNVDAFVDEEDISEDICDEIPDAPLAHLAHFAAHLETALTPPVLAAVMVRAWLLVKKEDRADALFQAVFARSSKVRTMVVEREIPVAFLRGVQKHGAASVTLRRMLARYESADPEEICDLIEDLLFEELMAEEHSHEAILKHELTRRLILWMRSGGLPGGAEVGAAGFAGAEVGAPAHAARLREVGERLFEVAFVTHGGFLPEAHVGGAEDGGAGGACPWDSGALDLPLLARAPPTEDALQLARRILLRSARRRHAQAGGVDVPALAREWPLGRWPLCHDPALLGEAFALLSACWRAAAALPGLGDLAGPPPPGEGAAALGGCDRRAAEELLFRMFSDLEVWRLPQRELLTPWVPGQVLACHVAAQCSKLEERQLALVDETRENLEEIARLHAVIAQLSGRLEATDARSEQCMQKQADLNDTLRQLR